MSYIAPFYNLILVVHLVVCFFLISVILLQAGKGADMGAAFGAGGSQSLFGARGATTLLAKTTTLAAMIFLITSLSLAGIHKSRVDGFDKSVLPKQVESTSAPTETK